MRPAALLILMLLAPSCALLGLNGDGEDDADTAKKEESRVLRENLYENAHPYHIQGFKRVRLPFPTGMRVSVELGAFGYDAEELNHQKWGQEYQWRFGVAYNTPVSAAADGEVIETYEPNLGGGCDPEHKPKAHELRIRHTDGTIARYRHVRAAVTKGTRVKAGEVIAVTDENGFICSPGLVFSVLEPQDPKRLSVHLKTIPLYFMDVPDGIARQGAIYIAKKPEAR